MASDTSTSSSDLSEHIDEPILSEEDAENEETETLDARQKRSKKPPARYFDAFQTDKDKLEVEMKDSKFS
jgi:hypothetical protein